MYEHLQGHLSKHVDEGWYRGRRLPEYLFTVDALVNAEEVFTELLGSPISRKDEAETTTIAIDEFFAWLGRMGIASHIPDWQTRSHNYTFWKTFAPLGLCFSDVNGSILQEAQGGVLLSRGILPFGNDTLRTVMAACLVTTNESTPPPLQANFPKSAGDKFTLSFMTRTTHPFSYGALLFPFRRETPAHKIEGYYTYNNSNLTVALSDTSAEALPRLRDLAHIPLRERRLEEAFRRTNPTVFLPSHEDLVGSFLEHFFVETPASPTSAHYFPFFPKPKSFVRSYV